MKDAYASGTEEEFRAASGGFSKKEYPQAVEHFQKLLDETDV